jgi:hypothetical protein
VSEEIRARVLTALDRLEQAEQDLMVAARRVQEAREVLRSTYHDQDSSERVRPCICQAGEGERCSCGSK